MMASLKVKEVFCLFYSILLFISGILLAIFSIILFYRLCYHFEFVPNENLGPIIVLLLFGILHIFLTWIAINGPRREHNFYIYMFIIFSSILLIGELSIGIWSIIQWEDSDFRSVQLMTESFDELMENDYNKKEWIRLESKLKCCGLNGVDDYKQIKNVIPYSCCNLDVMNNSTCPHLYETGCKISLAKYVKIIMVETAVMAFVSSILQGFGIFIFIVFLKELKKEREARISRRLAMQRQLSQENGQVISAEQ